MTSDRKQYVHSVKDFSEFSHTASFTANEIEKILNDIGPKKFSTITSDGASAMKLAKAYIMEKFPFILPVRCIAHHIQLICSDIIKKIEFGKKTLSQCQAFVTYFGTSYQSEAQLQDEIVNQMIMGGGLKSSVKTRWASAYDCVRSVLNLEHCIKKVSLYFNSIN